MELNDLGVVGVIAAAVLGSGGLWSFLSARAKAQAAAPAESIKAEADLTGAAAEFARRIGEASASLVEDLRKELKFVRGRCDELEALGGELKAKVDACEDRHDNCERNLEDVKSEIARLMRDNPPAGY